MASANIAFDNIPSSIRKPGKYFEFNTKLAVRTLPGNLQKMLIVGQRLSSGAALSNQLVDIFAKSDADYYFGRGSIAALMVAAAIAANPYLSLQAIALDDAGASIAATCTITITGTATTAGVVTAQIGDVLVQIAVAAADAQNAIAAALKAQFDKQPDLPVSATVATNVVTLTAKNKGTLGNGIKVSSSVTAGIGVTVAATAMTGGATDPTLATALVSVFAAGHNIVCPAWNDATNLTGLRTHLDAAGGPLEQRGAIGVTAHVGTISQATTLLQSINANRITLALLPSCYENVFELAAAYAAVIASEEDPARPLNTLALTGISAPPQTAWLDRVSVENCLYNGITPLTVGPGNKVQIERAITTYTLDPQGIPDIAWLDLTTIRSMDYVRKAIRERIALRFPREKLSERTTDKVRSEALDVLFKCEELEIVENVAANAAGVLCERDLQDPNRLNLKIPTDVVNGLHVVAGRLDLLL
jgi:phage tail sheath gpL-like